MAEPINGDYVIFNHTSNQSAASDVRHSWSRALVLARLRPVCGGRTRTKEGELPSREEITPEIRPERRLPTAIFQKGKFIFSAIAELAKRQKIRACNRISSSPTRVGVISLGVESFEVHSLHSLYD